ncbi:hypothetical protein NH398_11660 [Halomonas sp. CnH100-B]|uniref:hypothetical protein n=1 Tax=Halomonas sp. CnH100-B TaxID=2954490 RepID=UPI0020968B50|nr:hypothetical protein [Halomonas sp. CnH100-B]MCO7229881.1 hypothetical protein [Halomonas sp. CnH100-B]
MVIVADNTVREIGALFGCRCSILFSMYAPILTYKNSRLTPEARWLLMQWACVFGIDQSVVCPLQTLFKRLGLTETQGRRAWNVLIGKSSERQERFIEIERLPSVGRGRPRSRYRLSTELVQSLQMSTSISDHHASEISTLTQTTLLSAENKTKDLVRDGRRRRSRLTLPNRWLLMVLLAHADTPGVITSLGISKMRSMTGMSRSRIDRQLKKLVDLEIIAHYQPGRYASQANARRTSIYLLNLAHPLFRRFKAKPFSIMSFSQPTEPKQTELVGGIVDAAMTAVVSKLQINALLKEYEDSVRSSEGIAVGDDSLPTDTRHVETKDYQAIHNGLRRVYKNAMALLPGGRFLNDRTEELLKSYDADDAGWLLTNVHIDACQLLSYAWGPLKEGKVSPERPCHRIIVNTTQRLGLGPVGSIEASVDRNPSSPHGEEDQCMLNEHACFTIKRSTSAQDSYQPLALLSYALSYYLARELQKALATTKVLEVEAINYMLVPVALEHLSGQQQPAYELRSYGFHKKRVCRQRSIVIFTAPVDEDLHSYWRTHRQDSLFASSEESGDAVPGTDAPTTS